MFSPTFTVVSEAGGIHICVPPAHIGQVVRGTPTSGVLLHWVIISRWWEQNQTHNRERSVNADSPRTKKCCDSVAKPHNSRPPKHPRTDTVLPEHLLAHTLNYLCLLTLTAFGPFVTIFHVKMMF